MTTKAKKSARLPRVTGETVLTATGRKAPEAIASGEGRVASVYKAVAAMGKGTAAQAFERVRAAGGATTKSAWRDVAWIVRELARRGLVKLTPGPRPADRRAYLAIVPRDPESAVPDAAARRLPAQIERMLRSGEAMIVAGPMAAEAAESVRRRKRGN